MRGRRLKIAAEILALQAPMDATQYLAMVVARAGLPVKSWNPNGSASVADGVQIWWKPSSRVHRAGIRLKKSGNYTSSHVDPQILVIRVAKELITTYVDEISESMEGGEYNKWLRTGAFTPPSSDSLTVLVDNLATQVKQAYKGAEKGTKQQTDLHKALMLLANVHSLVKE